MKQLHLFCSLSSHFDKSYGLNRFVLDKIPKHLCNYLIVDLNNIILNQTIFNQFQINYKNTKLILNIHINDSININNIVKYYIYNKKFSGINIFIESYSIHINEQIKVI